MAREILFSIRVNDEERKLIKYMATRLQRSESDAVRIVIMDVAKGLLDINLNEKPSIQAQASTQIRA